MKQIQGFMAQFTRVTKKAKKAKQTEAQKLSKWTKTKKQLDYADAAQYDPGEGLTDDELAKEEASLMLPDDYYSGEDPFQWEEYQLMQYE